MKKRFVRIASLLIVVVAIWGVTRDALAGHSYATELQVPQAGKKAKSAISDVPEYYDLLVLGIDRRPYQKTGRSDVIMIIHCEPGHVTLFSMPRDTLAPVRDRMDKINHAYAYGGIALSRATIERFLKFKVDNYITLDFETFLATVDTIKALTDDGRLIGAENLLMNGENLLKWLRFRSFSKGDRRRAQRHQLFMMRVLEYAQDTYKNKNTLFSQCVKAGLKIADSDLTYEHIAKLFETYRDFDIENQLERYVLPGGYQARNISDPSKSPPKPPDLSAINNDPNLTPEEKEARKAAAMAAYKKQLGAVANFYIPQYDWPLVTYIQFYRSKGLRMNYVDQDTLRK